MILLSLIILVCIVSLVISLLAFLFYFAESDMDALQGFKYSFTIWIVSCLLCIFSLKSSQREEEQCDVIIRNNVSYIYLDGHFINITGKYGKNFTEESVLAEFCPKQYVLGGFVYNDMFYLSKVR